MNTINPFSRPLYVMLKPVAPPATYDAITVITLKKPAFIRTQRSVC